MLTISRTYIRVEREVRDQRDLHRLARATFADVEIAATEFLPLAEFGSEVRVQEGSIEVVAVILAGASAVVTAISAYGSFSEGLGNLTSDAKRAGEFVRARVLRKVPGRVQSTRVTTGQLAQLDSVIKAVQSGKLSREQALKKASNVLRSGGEVVTPDIVANLEQLFGSVPSVPATEHGQVALPRPIGRVARASQGEIPGLVVQSPERPRRPPRGVILRRKPGSSDIQEEDL